MKEIIFRGYDRTIKMDLLNIYLCNEFNDRFEFRKDKRGTFYFYDYEDKKIIKSKEDIEDILNNYLDDNTKEDFYKLLKEIRGE